MGPYGVSGKRKRLLPAAGQGRGDVNPALGRAHKSFAAQGF